MTHDELLVQIDRIMNHEDWVLKKKYFKALRAIVELHKPAWWNTRNTDISEAYCVGCDDRCGCYEGDMNGLNRWINCPTIQAIEKELQ